MTASPAPRYVPSTGTEHVTPPSLGPRALTTEPTSQSKTSHFLDLVPGRENVPGFYTRNTSECPTQLPKPSAVLCPNLGPFPEGFQFIPKGERPPVREAPGPQPCPRGGREKTVVEAGAPPHGPRPSTMGCTAGRLRVPTTELAGGPEQERHRPAGGGSTTPPNPRAGLMTNTGRDARRRIDARTHVHAAPRSHDGACREREGARPSPARPAFPLLRTLCSRHLRPSAPASRLRPRPSRQRGSRPRSCLFKWWGQRAAPAAAAWVAPRAAIEGRTKMAAALAL